MIVTRVFCTEFMSTEFSLIFLSLHSMTWIFHSFPIHIPHPLIHTTQKITHRGDTENSVSNVDLRLDSFPKIDYILPVMVIGINVILLSLPRTMSFPPYFLFWLGVVKKRLGGHLTVGQDQCTIAVMVWLWRLYETRGKK